MPASSPLFRAESLFRSPYHNKPASEGSSSSDESLSSSESDEEDQPTRIAQRVGPLSLPASTRRRDGKLAQLITARRALDSRRYDLLLASVKSLDQWLAGQSIAALGSVLPIVVRFHDDLTEALLQPELADKARRRAMAADQAKSVVSLRSWQKMRLGSHWLEAREIVAQQEKPDCLLGVDAGTRALLASLEAALLTSPPRKLSLARHYLREVPEALLHLDEVVRYFESFDLATTISVEQRTRTALDSFTTLDLSHNAFTDIPSAVFTHLRQLDSLDLSHNALAGLPVAICRLQLRRLETKSNPLRRPNTFSLLRQARLARFLPATSGPPSLAHTCMRIIKARRLAIDNLPAHLAILAEHGYVCASRACTRGYIQPDDPCWLAGALYEERQILDRTLVFGGARLCAECLLRLR